MILEADSIWLEIEGRKILQSIYLKIETGTITGLLGRNGTGKSSLLKMIFGILKGQSQSVRIDGTYISDPYLAPYVIRYLPQHHFFPGYLTVKKVCRLYNVSFDAISAYFPELAQYKSAVVGSLSGGNSRLLEIMLILLSPVEFVLLDEPFAQLAPIVVETLLEVLQEQKAGKGILVSDHSYKNVLAASDNVYLLVPVGRSVLLKDPETDLRIMGYLH